MDPDQTPQNVASDQGLYGLLFYLNLNKMKINTQPPLKQKWTGPIDKIGEFHSA